MLPDVISIIENFSPFLAERVEMTLIEGHTSGRMEEEGAYGYTIKQFMNSPIFGSYFRIVTPNLTWRGMYPHNIILELLITFGVVGLIPFLYFLKIIFIKLRKSFCYDISNINSNTFLEHYKVYHRYKCIAKILNLRHLDIELNKSLYLKFYDKIEHLKHIHDNHAYQNAIVKFMNNVLINFEYKLNDISSLK